MTRRRSAAQARPAAHLGPQAVEGGVSLGRHSPTTVCLVQTGPWTDIHLALLPIMIVCMSMISWRDISYLLVVLGIFTGAAPFSRVCSRHWHSVFRQHKELEAEVKKLDWRLEAEAADRRDVECKLNAEVAEVLCKSWI